MDNNKVYYFTSKYFSDTKIIYGFFTRNGGKSNKTFDSLNCSFSSEDDKINVNENISVTKQKLGLKQTRIKFVSQIHGTHIEIIDNNNIPVIITDENYKIIDHKNIIYSDNEAKKYQILKNTLSSMKNGYEPIEVLIYDSHNIIINKQFVFYKNSEYIPLPAE